MPTRKKNPFADNKKDKYLLKITKFPISFEKISYLRTWK